MADYRRELEGRVDDARRLALHRLGWPHRHTDPLKDRCAVTRRLALMERTMEEIEGTVEELDHNAVTANGTTLDEISNSVTELEQRIEGLESWHER